MMNGGIVLEFLNIGGPEMMVIAFIGLLLFGGKKLPELARGLGKGIREFKDASEGVKREIQKNIEAVHHDIDISKEQEPEKTAPIHEPLQLHEPASSSPAPATGEQTHLT